MRKVFIQTNKKQILGAELAKYALNKWSPSLPVEIMEVEKYPEFKDFVGATYTMRGHTITYTLDDLQSFTLTRFKPPELMNYQGEALVIDPDIFALQDITPIFDLERNNKPILACRKKDSWDSSVMVLRCDELRNWNVKKMLEDLRAGKEDYNNIITLRFDNSRVEELSRDWNSHDSIETTSKMLHTTGRLTQPWKTGLKIDFTREPLPKLFRVIPREWIYKMQGKYPSRYQKHPKPEIEQFFLDLAREAYQRGAISKEFIQEEIAKKHVRSDLLSLVED